MFERMVVGLGLVLALTSPALAGVASQVPSQVLVEGQLGTAGNVAVGDGVYNVTLRLYGQPTGGVPLWQEGPLVVSTQGGLFSVTAGAIAPLSANLLGSASQIWLSLQVDADAELPRSPLRSVPFALRAQLAEGLACSGCVTAGMLDAAVLTGYAKTVDLSVFAKTTDLEAYAKTADLVVYAKLADLAPYATALELLDYAKLTDLAPYARLIDLLPYALKTDLAPYAKTADLTIFAKTADLASYVLATQLAPVAKTGSYNDLKDLPVLAKVNTACAIGTVVTGFDANGTPVCGGVVGSVNATTGGGLAFAGTGSAPTVGLSTACASGQLLKWNGSAWACAADSTGSGGVSGVTASAPIVSSGGTAPNLSIAQASASVDGFLASTDWASFNSKVASVIATTGGGLVVGGTATAPTLGLLTTCSSGQMLAWNGTAWACANGGGTLPADGLAAVSNGLLTDVFTNDFVSVGTPVVIKDAFPGGVIDSILVPDVGTAQKITVTVDIANSDLSGIKLELTDPNSVVYTLYTGGKPATVLQTSFPTPTPLASGDLSTWAGKNPKGTWVLKVTDSAFNASTWPIDGQLNSWKLTIQSLSAAKVASTGDLSMGGHRITDLADPLAAQDAATKNYVDGRILGGNGSDGALAISSGVTVIDLAGQEFFLRNYTSIAITGTGAVSFVNPNNSGTVIVLKSQGSVTLTSSATPCIDVSGLGAMPAAISPFVLDGADHSGTAGGTGQAANSGQANLPGGTGGAPGAVHSLGTKDTYLRLSIGLKAIAPGAAGGPGGTGGQGKFNAFIAPGGIPGAGGRGGGAILIEAAGSLLFSGTIWAKGLNGSPGSAATAASAGMGGGGGGGAGGAGGMVGIAFASLIANTGVVSVDGGSGGSGGGGGTASGACSPGPCGGSGGGGGGGGSGTTSGAAGSAGSVKVWNSNSSDGSAGGAGGTGAAGLVVVQRRYTY